MAAMIWASVSATSSSGLGDSTLGLGDALGGSSMMGGSLSFGFVGRLSPGRRPVSSEDPWGCSLDPVEGDAGGVS